MKFLHLMLLIFALVLGALTPWLLRLSTYYVTVQIKNLDEIPVSEIAINFQNTEGKGTFKPYMDRPLQTNEEIDFHFYVESEGAFSLRATFSDEKTVDGMGGYVERGDTLGMEIRSDRIGVLRK
jgi:hypothetical protein